ncbi:uncharacterized protein [Dermacentor andersoni]|uniref:uncharacterized protein n=1 Tax=Dermacentor andersoni TaxID=34620 RepID=UPI002416B0E1|nr:papilin-like [Dermacentor andersoni]
MAMLLFTLLTYCIVCFTPRDGETVSISLKCSSMPSDVEDCDSPTDKWFYNKKEKKCENFKYGDCPRNENIFDDETTCKTTCANAITGPEENETGTGTVKGGRGGESPAKTIGTVKGGRGDESPAKTIGSKGSYTSKTKKPKKPNKRPVSGSKSKQGSLRAKCVVRAKKGSCDDYSDMWYNNPGFYTCSRVPEGWCPTRSSFFESCEECMENCQKTRIKQCDFKS